jgi:hypothetical protein
MKTNENKISEELANLMNQCSPAFAGLTSLSDLHDKVMHHMREMVVVTPYKNRTDDLVFHAENYSLAIWNDTYQCMQTTSIPLRAENYWQAMEVGLTNVLQRYLTRMQPKLSPNNLDTIIK